MFPLFVFSIRGYPNQRAIYEASPNPTLSPIAITMTVQRRGDFPLHELIPILETNGWDVSVDETLIAARADANGMFQLKVDKGGRVYLRRTSMATPPHDQTQKIDGRRYAVHVESLTTTEATTTLDHANEFPQALKTMMQLALSSASDFRARS